MADSHPNPKDRQAAIDWARRVMASKHKYVILDTETTGLNKSDEIIQLAVIDLDGNTLFNENIRPTKKKRISAEAVAIHGLTMRVLSNCPTFAELAEPLERAIGTKTIITYNGEFDARMYTQTYLLAGGFLHRGNWECIMLEYAKYVGEWNDYYQDYRWQKLPGGEHSALGDCLATLEVLRTMAGAIRPGELVEKAMSEPIHCANCGRPIGQLEKTVPWDGKIVCFECSDRLRRQNDPDQFRWRKLLSKQDDANQHEDAVSVRNVVLTEHTAKKYKAGQLVGALMVVTGLVWLSVDGHQDPLPGTVLLLAGPLVFTAARIEGWWHHG